MFDISKFDTMKRSEEGVDMVVLHPKSGAAMRDDVGDPVTVKLLGRNSEKFRALQRTLTSRRVSAQGRGVVWGEAEQKAERLEVLTTCTLGWSFDTNGGEPFRYSPDNAVKLWSDPRWEWLAGQAYQFVLEEGNFLAH